MYYFSGTITTYINLICIYSSSYVNAVCQRMLISDFFLEDWRCDQHRWINQGVKMLPKSNPRLRKSYFVVDTLNGPSKDFGKHAYQLISSKTFTLIHYLGNETVAIPFCHRNAKADPSASFVRTCRSIYFEYHEKPVCSEYSKCGV